MRLIRKPHQLLILVACVIVIAVSAIVFIAPIGRFGKACLSEDEYVRQTAEALQRYYQATGAFPKVSDSGQEDSTDVLDSVFLEGLRTLYGADLFSLDNPNEMFVYFRSNCKLKVAPGSYDVYPR